MATAGSQSRIGYNNQYGQLGQPMWPQSRTIDFGQVPNFQTTTAGVVPGLANAPNDYIPIIIEPGRPNQEIVWLTAYVQGGSSVT